MASSSLRGAYQVVDCCGADGVDEVDNDLKDEDGDQKGCHFGE